MENVEHDTLVWQGGEVKAIDENGKVGGYLVQFSTDADPDLARDFFTDKTDFGPIKQSPILYHHGMDAAIKGTRLGLGSLSVDDVGVWLEGQLELRNEYEKAIFEMAKAGKLGWSSGTASHLVTRKAVGSAMHITSWPLGLDASLTPTPCEPRTQAVPLKSFDPSTISWDVTNTGISPLHHIAELESSEAGGTEAAIEAAVIPAEVKSEAANQPATMENQEQAEQPEKVELVVNEAIKSQEPSQIIVPTKNVVISIDQYNALMQGESKAFSQDPARVVKASFETSANIITKTGLGDNETKAVSHWIRTGDSGGVSHMKTNGEGARLDDNQISIKASNATDMNITTAADGGNLVPTGHFQGIIARRDEAMLAAKVGVRNIPGKGTTVNVPLDGEDDGEFISTAEAAGNDLDAPSIGTAAMTLVNYTKRVDLSNQLMNDEDSSLMTFLADFVGRGMSKTHNDLLQTEIMTNGTNLKTFAGAAAIAAGELQDMVFNNNLSAYLDDSSSVAWAMRPATYGLIAKLQGTDFIYDDTPQGSSRGQRSLLQYPVYYSNKIPAATIGLKSMIFGNFFYVGVRNDPEFTVLRDPYSKASTGQLSLHYYFRTTYKVLQSEAIGYGTQA